MLEQHGHAGLAGQAHHAPLRVHPGGRERLVLVAPPAFLGVLRDKLPPRVEARVTDVIEKDYLHLDARTLKERLEQELAAS